MENLRNYNSSERLREIVTTFFKGVTQPGSCVAVAYSGGLDSTVLLHSAKQASETLGFSLSSIHVNHQISPNGSNWVSHCEKTATAWGVPHKTVHIEVPRRTRDGLELAARRKRYEVLASLSDDWIALGHHQNDQAETVIHNLMRGAGVRGMASMRSVNSHYLRPLLSLSRGELFAYATHYNLNWCEDESNEDVRHTRNYIRQNVMPMLTVRFPAAARQLAKAAARFGDAQELLENLARIDCGAEPACLPFPQKVLANLEHRRSINLLRSLLAWENIQAPNQARLEEFVRQVREARPGRNPSLKFGSHRLHLNHGMIEITQLDI